MDDSIAVRQLNRGSELPSSYGDTTGGQGLDIFQGPANQQGTIPGYR